MRCLLACMCASFYGTFIVCVDYVLSESINVNTIRPLPFFPPTVSSLFKYIYPCTVFRFIVSYSSCLLLKYYNFCFFADIRLDVLRWSCTVNLHNHNISIILPLFIPFLLSPFLLSFLLPIVCFIYSFPVFFFLSFLFIIIISLFLPVFCVILLGVLFTFATFNLYC